MERSRGNMRQYVEEIRKLPDGSPVKGRFAVRSKEQVQDYKSKEGKYFFLDIADRTGSIRLKFWGGTDSRPAVELYNSLQPGDVVMLTGTVAQDRFDNAQVITVNEGTQLLKRVEGVPAEELPEYLPATRRDRRAMMDGLLGHVRAMGNAHLRALLDSFFSDAAFRDRYMSSPSAIVHHHNVVGGNLEHSLNVVGLCLRLCDSYPELDRDLLVTGAILHDVGKLDEYSSRAAITMTDEGRFLGHVAIGTRLVTERARSVPGFPPELLMKLGHMIQSHHGSFDPGNALKGMKIPEAAALHLADEADAMTKEFLQAVEGARQGQDPWVYDRRIGNEIYTR
ncbi:MAG: HD domain-containing protein [Euryarchaeota archaeon]|nr:HD domain-containing protein [Euryarchaeota archaeon]